MGYGQYDVRATESSFLAALKSLPAPRGVVSPEEKTGVVTNEIVSSFNGIDLDGSVEERPATEVLGDLPASCLMAYYESRRRWLFGGSSLSTRNVHCEGVCNDGSNSHHYAAATSDDDEPLLASAGVGVSTLNKMSTVKMGDYRERLLWTRAPVVGWGANDSCGVSATTGADGSPIWSVDDDALPLTFFDPKTGEFIDSVQTRLRSRLTVHFGNPFKDKRGDSIIPESFADQRPPRKGSAADVDDGDLMMPPGSPPHESSLEGEGEAEAIFASPRKSPVSPSKVVKPLPPAPQGRKRELPDMPPLPPEAKRSKHEEGTPPTTISPEGKKPAAPLTEPRKPPAAPRVPPPPPTGKQAPPPPPGITKTKKGPPPPPRPPPSLLPSTAGSGPPPSRPPKGTKRPSITMPPPKAPPPKMPKPPPRAAAAASSPSSKSTSGEVTIPGTPSSATKPPPRPKRIDTAAVAAAAAPDDIQSPDERPNVTLPPGWMSVWSKSQKRWYFFDKRTNKSVWQWPPPTS